MKRAKGDKVAKDALAAASTENEATSGDEPVSMTEALEHYRVGRLPQAERMARAAIAANIDDHQAASLLGAIAARTGHNEDAIGWMMRAARVRPDEERYHANLCELFRKAGRLHEALKAGARAVSIEPRYAPGHNNLAQCYLDGGDPVRAESCARKALELTPDFAEAWNSLGNALRAQKRFVDAETAYRRAIGLNARYFEALSNCGMMLRDRGQPDAAEKPLRDALALKPGGFDPMLQLALNCQAQGKLDEALSLLTRAVAIDPTRADAFLTIARILAGMGKVDGAVSACRGALKARPDHPTVLNLLARLLREREDTETAIAYCRRALEQKPDAPDILNNLGIALLESGDLDGAVDVLTQAVARQPHSAATFINLAAVRRFKPGDPEIEVMLRLLDSMAETDRHAIGLRFALGKVHDDIGEAERAFAFYADGAALKRRTITYNEGGIMRLFDRIRHVFTADFIAGKSGLGDPDARHVFIVGMPRSGSTLIEQILASHGEVQAMGEVKHLHNAILSLDDGFSAAMRYPELTHMIDGPQLQSIVKHYHAHCPGMADGKVLTTDKMLTNYYYVGLIHLLFPNARIIHSRRNPIDTCLSCFSKLFREEMAYTYDLHELARYYRKCDELMAHWKAVLPEGVILDVHYEDVVSDVEPQAQRILAHCGLDWDPACLDFHKNGRVVKTASVAQVRRPLYASSVERWRRYGDAIEPLIAALGPLASAAR